MDYICKIFLVTALNFFLELNIIKGINFFFTLHFRNFTLEHQTIDNLNLRLDLVSVLEIDAVSASLQTYSIIDD